MLAFLNGLTYSEQGTSGLRETYNRWRKQGQRVLRKLEKSSGNKEGASLVKGRLNEKIIE